MQKKHLNLYALLPLTYNHLHTNYNIKKDIFKSYILFYIFTFIYLASKFPEVIKLGKMKYPMAFYLSSITLHGLLGLVSAIFISTTPVIVMGIGSLLFMVSDYILTVDRFIIQKNKWIVRGNSLTYFVGILLIVLSLGL